jgi:hypothetical protein
LFQEHMAEAIKNTPIIRSQDKDCLCWKLTHAGIAPKARTKHVLSDCLNRGSQGQDRSVLLPNNYFKLFWRTTTLYPE